MQTVTRMLLERTLGLGKSSVWDDRSGHLYWVDIKATALHHLDPQTGTHTHWDWPEVISCCGLAQSGDFIVGGRSLTHPIPVLADDMRTNEGKVGPDGAFWISTIRDRSDRAPLGVLMRIAPDGDVRILLDEFTAPNGIEWGLDGRSFYIADTRALWSDCWDYDPQTVTLENRPRFVSYGDDSGKSDGAAMDADGGYWSSGIYAGIIHRFDTQSARTSSIQMPTKMTTMPCFGSADMKRLYVTFLTPDGSGSATDGGLYSTVMDVAGRPPHRFGQTQA